MSHVNNPVKVHPQQTLQLSGCPQQQMVILGQPVTAHDTTRGQLIQHQFIDGGFNGGSGFETKQKIEILEQKMALLQDFKFLNWFGIVFAAVVIIACFSYVCYILSYTFKRGYNTRYFQQTGGPLIGVFAAIIVFKIVQIISHCYGLGANKRAIPEKMKRAGTFYRVLLVLGCLHFNILDILVYYLLFRKAEQLEGLFRELKALKEKL